MSSAAHDHSVTMARVGVIYCSAWGWAGMANPDATAPDIVELNRMNGNSHCHLRLWCHKRGTGCDARGARMGRSYAAT